MYVVLSTDKFATAPFYDISSLLDIKRIHPFSFPASMGIVTNFSPITVRP